MTRTKEGRQNTAGGIYRGGIMGEEERDRMRKRERERERERKRKRE